MTDDGLAYLLGRVGLVEDRIRVLVQHRRQSDPAPDDPFRGLYLTEEAVDRLLETGDKAPPPDDGRRALVERVGAEAEAAGVVVRLRDLAKVAGLTDLDTELLLVALVPDLDGRFERLYGYLNDDVTRRRATIGLALELAGAAPASAASRARLAPSSPLVDLALVMVDDDDRPFLTRALRVPDRVTGHLLGDDSPDGQLAGILVDVTSYDVPPAEYMARALEGGARLVYVHEPVRGSGAAVAAAAVARSGRTVLQIDLARLGAESNQTALVTIAAREALLRGAGLVAGPVEALVGSSPQGMRRLTALPLPVLLVGSTSWDPEWSDQVPLLAEVPVPGPAQRTALWRDALDGRWAELPPSVATHFVLGPRQVVRAVQAAEASASAAGTEVTPEMLRRGARAQNAAGLERLARRLEPAVTWDDLVLPGPVLGQLHDLANRARHRDMVLTQWRMRPGGGRGHGVTALFAGDSGTGKTMSCEVIAADLGLDVYAVNLATVVDKYVGETEKNLERIFTEASGVNAVLLFDEADAIFGKRAEVRDAHDRYANIESAYLLQRMETFEGLAVLATNLRSNVDEAFTRRLDAIIDFPSPDEDLRLRLWQRCLAPPLPVGPDLDLGFCARSFVFSGGNIRSVAVTAAYLAAAAERPITMLDLVSAVQQEYRKLGRLVLQHEFGEYLTRLR